MSMQLQAPSKAPAIGLVKHSVTMLLGLWLIVGVFIDGFAHNHGEVETIFTPWHAILYSGYLACALWILIIIVQNKSKKGYMKWTDAVPAGYKLGAAGVVIFFLGGIGDMTWHTIFGIEKDIAALLSPTHLILLSGALLILTSPYRAICVSETGEAPGFRRLLPAFTSVALTFAVMAFFLMYAWSFRNGLGSGFSWGETAKSVVDFLITTMLLVIPILLVLKRWRLPFGAVTYFFVFEGVLMSIFDGFSQSIPIRCYSAACRHCRGFAVPGGPASRYPRLAVPRRLFPYSGHRLELAFRGAEHLRHARLGAGAVGRHDNFMRPLLLGLEHLGSSGHPGNRAVRLWESLAYTADL